MWQTKAGKESLYFFFIIKPNRCINFTNLFWYETLHVSDSSSVHHQKFIHCTLSNGICHTAVEQDQDGTAVPSWSCSTAVWHMPLLSVQWINSWWWTEELSETCRVSCQNKFVKLMHLVGFIIKKFVKMDGHVNAKKKPIILTKRPIIITTKPLHWTLNTNQSKFSRVFS